MVEGIIKDCIVSVFLIIFNSGGLIFCVGKLLIMLYYSDKYFVIFLLFLMFWGVVFVM